MIVTSLSLDEQVALLMQGTEYGDETLTRNMATELRARLAEGRPLRVYCGYDPTRSDLHLGHTITMRKLRQFQELGHEVTFLIGNYTSLIGDPSDKDKLRPMLTSEVIAENGRTYAEQAFKILDRDKTRIQYNAEWLSKLTFLDLIQMAQNFTVQQFMTRDNFAKRFEKGEAIYLHETFYSLMQGYDAVALQADVQVGGTEQLFNIITAGRRLQEMYGQKPQIGVLMSILPGTDGVVRMSKSLGNHIPILAEPEDMYGKVMSIPDSAMLLYFKLATRYTPDRIAAIERGLQAVPSLHPRDVKMELAREIVSIFHDEAAAQRAEEHFRTVFQQRNAPTEMDTYRVTGKPNIVDVVVGAKLAPSKSEARRLIAGGGVYLDGRTVSNPFEVIDLKQDTVLQVGKRRFVRLINGTE